MNVIAFGALVGFGVALFVMAIDWLAEAMK
jgi:hypothetical protein